MLDSAFYLVTAEIARRSGVMANRYMVADGRFVLDNKDLSGIRLTADEYLTGLQGVEKVSESMARTLIAQGGYKLGGRRSPFASGTSESVAEGTEEPQTTEATEDENQAATEETTETAEAENETEETETTEEQEGE